MTMFGVCGGCGKQRQIYSSMPIGEFCLKCSRRLDRVEAKEVRLIRKQNGLRGLPKW